MENFQQFQPHRHHKGGLYLKLCEARQTETQEVLVVYACAVSGDVFCRPKIEFEGLLPDGHPRFAPVPYVANQQKRLNLFNLHNPRGAA